MRYGVIADVHANVHALEATLGFLAALAFVQRIYGYVALLSCRRSLR